MKNRKITKKDKKNIRKQNITLLFLLALLAVTATGIAGAGIYYLNRDNINELKINTTSIVRQKNTTDDAEAYTTLSESTTEQQSVVSEEVKTAGSAQKTVEDMSLEEKVYQMFIITPEALTGEESVTTANDITKDSLGETPVGGIIYFGANITDEQQIKKLISDTKTYAAAVCKVPLFIAVDEEGGTVARLANTDGINVPKVANMAEIGKSGSQSSAYEAGKTIGTYLADYGFNLDFAPVADVLTNSQNTVVADRSFGSDPIIVSAMAQQVSDGLNECGILSCFKHYPGHGSTTDDTHDGFAYTDKSFEELSDSELIPFVNAVHNNADFIMAGHISVPGITGDNTPASLSKKMIDELLIQKMGYKGIVITDSLSMGAISNVYSSDEAAVAAVEAGCDMLLMPVDFNEAAKGITDAVKDGRISEDRINRSIIKIIEVKNKLLP